MAANSTCWYLDMSFPPASTQWKGLDSSSDHCIVVRANRVTAAAAARKRAQEGISCNAACRALAAFLTCASSLGRIDVEEHPLPYGEILRRRRQNVLLGLAGVFGMRLQPVCPGLRCRESPLISIRMLSNAQPASPRVKQRQWIRRIDVPPLLPSATLQQKEADWMRVTTTAPFRREKAEEGTGTGMNRLLLPTAPCKKSRGRHWPPAESSSVRPTPPWPQLPSAHGSPPSSWRGQWAPLQCSAPGDWNKANLSRVTSSGGAWR